MDDEQTEAEILKVASKAAAMMGVSAKEAERSLRGLIQAFDRTPVYPVKLIIIEWP